MPVVAELNADIHQWSRLAKDTNAAPKAFEHRFVDKLPTLRLTFVNQFVIPVLKEIDHFATVDTLARYYYLRNKPNELYRLKKVIDGYFTLRQFTLEGKYLIQDSERKQPRKDYDSRYDSLLAAILEPGAIFKDDVSFVSWNYDLEFERSLAKFKGSHIIEKIDQLYHINGHSLPPSERFNDTDLGWMQYLDSQGGHDIRYAWERLTDVKAELKTRLANTTHLVVIGYSFPVFNREVDRQILAAPNLKKVYLQDLPKALPGIENRVKALLGERARFIPEERIDVSTKDGIGFIPGRPQQGVELELIDSVDQFHIPFELL